MAHVIERGGRASFAGIATAKCHTVREALREQGIERLMLETDCPYLSPEPHRGKSNEPAYLASIAEHCAQTLAVPLADLAARISDNTRDFFNLK